MAKRRFDARPLLGEGAVEHRVTDHRDRRDAEAGAGLGFLGDRRIPQVVLDEGSSRPPSQRFSARQSGHVGVV